MDLSTKGIFISMFQLAAKGELNQFEQKDVITALMSYGNFLLRNKPYDEVVTDFIKIREGSRLLLENTEKCIDSALENIKYMNDTVESIGLQIQNLPEYAEIGDNTETLAFIKSLTQDLYNFSDAEKLTGVTRQTLKKHAEKELHGLKVTVHGKSTLLSKERLITYYRAKFKDNSLLF